MLSLTDHDDVSGLQEAQTEARGLDIQFVPGVEISVTWEGQGVHVLGLGIDPSHPDLRTGLHRIQTTRETRASRIAEQLDAVGISGSLEGAARHALNPATIGRGHFARYIVETGLARDVQDVFKRYLAAGKPGFVPQQWGRRSAGFAHPPARRCWPIPSATNFRVHACALYSGNSGNWVAPGWKSAPVSA